MWFPPIKVETELGRKGTPKGLYSITYDPVGVDKEKKEITNKHSHNSIKVWENPSIYNGFKQRLACAYYGRPDKLCMAIGDVSGKGVPASLFMAITQTYHRGLVISKDNSPQQVVSSLNSFVSNNNIANMFVTYLFAIVDLKTGIMSYCNAGHNPFYVIRVDGTVEKSCKRHGIPLGAFSDSEYGQSDLPLNHGDMVVFYTDGVTEANNSKEELFGDQALVAILEKCGAQHLSAEETRQAIFDAVISFETDAEQFDDITIMCFKYI